MVWKIKTWRDKQTGCDVAIGISSELVDMDEILNHTLEYIRTITSEQPVEK